MADWVFLCTRLHRGLLPPDIAAPLAWCLLHGLYKNPEGTKLRPLAVGEDVRREAGRSLMVSLRPQIRAYFVGEAQAGETRPLQLALGVAGGGEALVHIVRLFLAQHPDYGAFRTDAKNAFNAAFRHVILRELRARFPQLFHFVA